MHDILFLLVLLFLDSALGLQFTNPPSDGAVVATTDFSTNPVYTIGDFMNVQWTPVPNPNNNRISITMWQLNGSYGFIGGSEYVAPNCTPDALSAPWTVNTQDDLSVSNMFYFNLFLEGETSSIANSHYFNITNKAANPSSSSSSSTTSTETPTVVTTSIIISVTPSNSRPHAATTSKSDSSSSSSSTGTPITPAAASITPAPSSPASSPSALTPAVKAGIGIGATAAVLVGLFAGWFFGRGRRNKANQSRPMSNTLWSPTTTTVSESGGVWPKNHDGFGALGFYGPYGPLGGRSELHEKGDRTSGVELGGQGRTELGHNGPWVRSLYELGSPGR